MPKFRFLCANHRQWLTENPAAVQHTWAQAYSRSLELIDEHNLAEAANHAGAAFETAEIGLLNAQNASAMDIHRYSDTGVLLVQILQQLSEVRLARAIIASAIGQLEQLLIYGMERKAVLAGCDRLLRMGDDLPAPGMAAANNSVCSPRTAARLH